MRIWLIVLMCFCTALVTAQSTNRDVHANVTIGNFFLVGDSVSYQGVLGITGANGYDVSDLSRGNILVDDLHHRYLIDTIFNILTETSLFIKIRCLEAQCLIPQIGAGFVFKPTENLGLELIPENGSSFISEAIEAKAINHNFLTLDQKIDPTIKGIAVISGDINDGSYVNIDLGQNLYTDTYWINCTTEASTGLGAEKLFVYSVQEFKTFTGFRLATTSRLAQGESIRVYWQVKY